MGTGALRKVDARSTKTISIAKDFSERPAGRYLTDGKFSGQAFREKLLLPNLIDGQTLVVELDGVRGYPSSFLEEAFGGLVRKHNLSAADLLERLTLSAVTPAYRRYIDIIWGYVRTADKHRRD